MLRSDGAAVACGGNMTGECDVPALVAGFAYTHVAAGEQHTVLLRSDGTAVACGLNDHGQCDLPALASDLAYTHASGGYQHTVLLRSDGTAVACGSNRHGQCHFPALVAGLTYTAHLLLPVLLLQASLDGAAMRFATLGGLERLRIEARPSARLADIYEQLVADQCPEVWRVDAVLPGGQLLSSASIEETVASAFGLVDVPGALIERHGNVRPTADENVKASSGRRLCYFVEPCQCRIA
ncbi:unnamed protein product [Prorocentrum cordatum]|uniref:Uncharacterized protein n=1 Tax=Prorocentrum cordatum TaxID=2364126 RepID=A0ABN9WK44_9DINO|nr:unnamed protein product [Polarella glacialis]